MKNRFEFTVLLFAAVIISTTTRAEPIIIKFSHIVAENTPKGIMANHFKELIAERLSGKVEIKVYPSGQLFGDNKVLEAILLGDIQLAAPSVSKFRRYSKKLQVFDLPFLFNDMAAVERFQQSPKGQALLDVMKKKGLKGLGYMHNGLKQLSSSVKIETPADAKNLKFRIMSSDVLAAQFQALGAMPLKKPYSEVFTLLQTKAIDGQENTWSNIYSKKFYEIQPYIAETNHGVLDYMFVTSVEFWDSLPKDIRTEVKKALDESILLGNIVAAEKTISDRQIIIDSKRTTVVPISAENHKKWKEVMRPVWKKFEQKIGKDLIDAAIAANEYQ
ncbi:MAG: TRAP transporter substrate-binding protein [Gammaproteobacteria bacterium]|nr:TRAP transporter substrate-binding protein [Gammaproteobacteria bacterium]